MDDRETSHTHSVDTDETTNLIAASKVEGTNVYNTKGESLGSIEDLMIDKRSGKVAYAIMAFGGFLGMGHSHHPLPWNMLDYDERQNGYVVNLDKDSLKDAPHHLGTDTPDYSGEYGREVDDFYANPSREGRVPRRDL